MILLGTQSSTTLIMLTYVNTANLASNTAPALSSQRMTSSISIGGQESYTSPALSDGTLFDGGDDRVSGLSYASGRLLASCTTYFGPTAATPKVREGRGGSAARRGRRCDRVRGGRRPGGQPGRPRAAFQVASPSLSYDRIKNEPHTNNNNSSESFTGSLTWPQRRRFMGASSQTRPGTPGE